MTKRLPLEGVRVIDFCVVWAGPFGTMQLGDLGAEVIKVENIHAWQPLTRGLIARPSSELCAVLPRWQGAYPNGGRIPRPYNACPTFVQLFRNKYSVTMDIRVPEGREAFEKLVRISDVFYENNVTETLPKLGITYEYLCSLKPDIIMLRAPAYGSSGPYRNYRALGVHLEGVSGHSMLRHYPDTDPSTNTQIYAGDYFAGTHGAFGVIAALEHRRLTGEGQLIEIPQVETAAGMLAQFSMDFALNGRPGEAIGNRDIHGGVPCGVYRTRGEDRWLAVTVYGDEQWGRLVEVLGSPAWALEPRFATEKARRANEDDLDRLLGQELRERDRWQVACALQERGVAAGPVMDAKDAFENEHLSARGTFVPMDAHESGPHEWAGPLWKFSDAPVTVRKRPVALGEDNEFVYRQLLGYSDEEYRALEDAGHIGTEFDPGIQ
jgi:crotonobetainyl-CoA:carnitine CoA-transferase CaiB-like acyl-CoA transferase